MIHAGGTTNYIVQISVLLIMIIESKLLHRQKTKMIRYKISLPALIKILL